jgi:hypothetical protein
MQQLVSPTAAGHPTLRSPSLIPRGRLRRGRCRLERRPGLSESAHVRLVQPGQLHHVLDGESLAQEPLHRGGGRHLGRLHCALSLGPGLPRQLGVNRRVIDPQLPALSGRLQPALRHQRGEHRPGVAALPAQVGRREERHPAGPGAGGTAEPRSVRRWCAARSPPLSQTAGGFRCRGEMPVLPTLVRAVPRGLARTGWTSSMRRRAATHAGHRPCRALRRNRSDGSGSTRTKVVEVTGSEQALMDALLAQPRL